jgi:hypothetical protein
MKRIFVFLLLATACFGQVENNQIIVTPLTNLSAGGQLQFPDLTGSGNYVGFANPAVVQPVPIVSVTTANPIVVTLGTMPLTLPTTVTIGGAVGCSVLNATLTITSHSSTTLTFGGVSGAACGSYTSNSGLAQFQAILWELPGQDCAGPFQSDGLGHLSCNPAASSTYLFGTGLNANTTGGGIAITFAQTDPTNILFNPGFEDSPPLTQWTIETGTVVIDVVDFYNGSQSAKFTGNAKLDQRFQVQVGAQYSGTVEFIGSSGANGTAELLMAYENAAGAILSGQSFTATGTPTTSWQELTLSTAQHPAPSTATYVLYQLNTSGQTTGYIAFDQATMRYINQNDTIGLGSIIPVNIGNGHTLTEIVGGLPTCGSTNYPVGTPAFNTVDGLLYHCNSSGWSTGVKPGDMIAGTLASGVVIAGSAVIGALTAGTISANFITTGFLTVGSGITIQGTLTVGSGLTVAGSITGTTMTLNANGITSKFDNGSSFLGTYGISTVSNSNSNIYGTLYPGALEIGGSNSQFELTTSSTTSELELYAGGSNYVSVSASTVIGGTVSVSNSSGNGVSIIGAGITVGAGVNGNVGLDVSNEAIFYNSQIGIGSTGIAIGSGMAYQANGQTGYTNASFACSGSTHIHSADIIGGLIIGAPGCN